MVPMIATAGFVAMLASCFLRRGPMKWGLLWGFSTRHTAAGKVVWTIGAVAVAWALFRLTGL
jgi:hypothetical protein